MTTPGTARGCRRFAGTAGSVAVTCLARLALLVALVCFPGVARSGETESEAGAAQLPSGSAVISWIGREGSADSGDVDDYRVEVEGGRKLTATLTDRGHGAPGLSLSIVDELGAVVASDTDGLRLHAAHRATVTSALRVRVQRHPESDGQSREYALRVTVAGPTGLRVTDPLPDSNGVHRFAVPARGGALISARVRPERGSWLQLLSVQSPQGAPVPVVWVRQSGRAVTVLPFRLPADAPFGDWILTFSPRSYTYGAECASFVATVKSPRIPPRRGRLSAIEPRIESVTPEVVADGTVIRLSVEDAGDPQPSSPFVVRVGRTVLADAAYDPPNQRSSVRATIPESLPAGTFDLSIETATGQVAVLPGGLTKVRPPVAESFLPTAVPAGGGFEVTIRGRDFRPGRMGVRMGGRFVPLIATSTATTLRFTTPPATPGETTVGVIDLDTQRESDVSATLLVAAWAEIGALSPQIAPSLGGTPVTVRGFYFAPDDTLEMETSTAGAFDALPSTYVSGTVRTFVAPARPPGTWGVRVRDSSGHISRVFRLRTFSWTDATAAWGLTAGAVLDATSSVVADLDRDGDADLVLGRDASGPAAATSHTRILRNDGAAGLVDATAAMMPPASASDDWRTSRVRVHDVTGDGWPDLVLGTADTDIIPMTRSHVRILRNEAKSAEEPDVRVFRDRTTDLFPAPARFYSVYGSSGTNDVDAWTAHDLWIGDLDTGADGTAEIVVTTDRSFTAQYVGCSPYCRSPYTAGYTYNIYWGGTRVFRWEPALRSGLGGFRRDFEALPNRVGLTAWIWGAPSGTTLPYCPPSSCAGTFTAFTGQRLAAGDVDGDGRTDLVVLSATAPTVNGAETSALQVFLGGRDPSPGLPWGWGGDGLDVTPLLTALGLDLRGDAVAAGSPGASGAPVPIAVGRSSSAAPGTGPGVRLLRYVPGADGAVGTFDDATDAILGPPPPGEPWWASALEWEDADGDGTDDLVVLGATAPLGAVSGLRILRTTDDGTLLDDVRALLESAAGAGLAGSALAIGDLDGDGGPDIVVSRATVAGPGAATRVLQQRR